MAKETAATLFLGTDFQYILAVLNEAETAALDITGWSISWMVKRLKSDTDANAILTKVSTGGTPAIVIAGTFNATPSVNTQRATLALVDTDTGTTAPGLYHYEFRRTDEGFETVLAYGPIRFVRGVHQ